MDAIWQAVFRAASASSPFLTVEWMSSWFRAFGDLMRPEVHLWHDREGRPMACCLVSYQRVKVGPFKVLRAFLNATGEGVVGSEHNDILVVPEHREPVTRALIRAIRDRGVDQLALAGFNDTGAGRIMDAWRAHGTVEGSWREDPYVDLGRLEPDASGYLTTLSRNTRSKIRRSMRMYIERLGTPRLQVAASLTEATQWLGTLIELHNQRWRAQGLPGAFASQRAMAFHRAVLERTLTTQGDLQVDLLRYSFGQTPIGLLYNLRCRRHVSFYQSGLSYDGDNRLKPGLVVHAAAVEHYCQSGSEEYDFLAGEPEAAQYKRSLATSTRRLFWGELSAASLRMKSIRALRRMRRRFPP